MIKKISFIYRQYLLGHPVLALLFLAVILAISATNIKNFTLDASADTLILEDDQDLKVFRNITERYQSSDFMILTLTDKNKNIFSSDTLRLIDTLSKEISAVENIDSVTSITNIPLVTSSNKPLTELINNIPNILSEDVDKNRAREEILTSPIYKDLVISSDAKTTAMQLVIKKNESLSNALKQRNLFFEKYKKDQSFENQYSLAKTKYQSLAEREKQKVKLLIEEIRKIQSSYSNDRYEIRLGGIPMITDDMITFIKNDLINLNLREVFPSGHDEIVALQEHNGFLVIFCKNSIIIYSGAEGNPNADTFKLHDIIDGVGCIARDSVQHTGTDIVFLSDSGVRSLGRLIQEKSLPMRDISKNIRSDLLRLVNDEKVSNEDLSTITSVYSPDEAFYLLTLPKNTTTFCFDARGALPDGSLRVTTWSDPIALCYTIRHDGSLVMGRQGGIYQYKGFSDKVCKEVNSALTYVSQTYLLSYFSNPLDFGNSTNLKFLKKFKMIIIGDSSAESTLNWGYDYSDAYSKQTFIPTTINAKTAFFGISEYGISSADAPTGATPDFSLELIDPADPSQGTQATTALSVEYSGGTEIQTPSVHGTGHGTVVTVGLESTINGAEFSIQRIDINVLFGRVI